MEWNSAKDKPPEQKWGWSKSDYFCACKYHYSLGRMKGGVWVDMGNRPIDVILWMEIPEISDKHKALW